MINNNQLSHQLPSDIKNKLSNQDLKILQANNAYVFNGNHNYFVNDCFKYNDMVLPLGTTCQDTESDPSGNMKELIDKVDNMSVSTMHSDKDSRRNSDEFTTDPTSVMMKRWESHI